MALQALGGTVDKATHGAHMLLLQLVNLLVFVVELLELESAGTELAGVVELGARGSHPEGIVVSGCSCVSGSESPDMRAAAPCDHLTAAARAKVSSHKAPQAESNDTLESRALCSRAVNGEVMGEEVRRGAG